MWWIGLVVIVGVVLALAFMADWDSEGGGCGGWLLMVVVVLAFVIFTGAH